MWLVALGALVAVGLILWKRAPRPKPEYQVVGYDPARGVMISARDGDLGELLPEKKTPDRPFPIDKLRPRSGTLFRSGDSLSIHVPLAPFRLPIYSPYEGEEEMEWEEVTTSLRLDFVRLPSAELPDLAGRTLNFPKNPEPGYLDGSLYIEHAHHPADVTQIRFGALTDEGLEAEMEVELCFEFEGLGDYRDAAWRCVTRLRSA